MSYKYHWVTPPLPASVDHNGLSVGLPVENWKPRPTPPRCAMTGKYCRLEPLDVVAHHAALFSAFAHDKDERNWTYLPYGPFSTVHEFNTWCESECTGDDPMFHTIIDQDGNQVIGMASYLRITPKTGSIEVGHIHFSPLMQKTRLATESMYLMMKRVFDELGYRRYEWKCNALNEPSCRAAERLGFTFEGIFRNATISKNRNRDTAWFAIIEEDWPKLKAGFECWLDEENFDDQAQQVRTLSQCIAKN